MIKYIPFKDLVAFGIRQDATLREIKEFICDINNIEYIEKLYSIFIGKCYKNNNELFKINSIKIDSYDNTNFQIYFNITSIFTSNSLSLIKEKTITNMWFDFSSFEDIDYSYFDEEYRRILSLNDKIVSLKLSEELDSLKINELNDKIMETYNFHTNVSFTDDYFYAFLQSENEDLTYEEYKKEVDETINKLVDDINLLLNGTLNDYYMVFCGDNKSFPDCCACENQNPQFNRDFDMKLNKYYTFLKVDLIEYDGSKLEAKGGIVYSIEYGEKYFRISKNSFNLWLLLNNFILESNRDLVKFIKIDKLKELLGKDF